MQFERRHAAGRKSPEDVPFGSHEWDAVSAEVMHDLCRAMGGESEISVCQARQSLWCRCACLLSELLRSTTEGQRAREHVMLTDSHFARDPQSADPGRGIELKVSAYLRQLLYH